MKALIRSTAALAALTSLALTGCADGTNTLATGSVNASKVAAKQKLDPACVVLTAKIDALRNEGTMARLEKVAAGKTRSVMIKRAAIAKATELDRTNTEYLAKCTAFKPTAKAAMPKTIAKLVTKKPAAETAAAAAKVAKPAVKSAKVTVRNAAKKAATTAATTTLAKKAATTAAAATTVAKKTATTAATVAPAAAAAVNVNSIQQ